MERIRRHLDENVNPAVADGLRRRGINVTTVRDRGLLAEADRVQFLFAQDSSRVLVTHDRDFLIMARTGVGHCGIVYSPVNAKVGDILRGLMMIVDVLTPDDMRNPIEFL